MSSPVKSSPLLDRDKSDVRCVNCGVALKNTYIKNDWGHLSIICGGCGQNFVICFKCKKLTTFYLYGGTDWISCDHCGTPFVHAGSSLVYQRTKEQRQEEKYYDNLREAVRRKYKEPIEITNTKL